jgi:hypothetical protein
MATSPAGHRKVSITACASVNHHFYQWKYIDALICIQAFAGTCQNEKAPVRRCGAPNGGYLPI